MTRVLHASKFGKADQISTFLWSAVDVLSGNEDNAEVSTVIKLYVELVRRLF